MISDDEQQDPLKATRRLIWIYCILWLIEGAIRKWIVPSLSLQLLLVRDPVVLMIYWSAIQARVFPNNGWIKFLWVLSAAIAVQAFFQLFVTGASLPVIAFGFRTFVLHLPLGWVVAAAFGRKEILTLGKWVLYIAPFLAALMVIQFEVGPDHWLNVASLKGGAQIGSVFGRIRPPAIFSFITGPIHYFALCTAFVMAGFLKRELFSRVWLILGVISILLAMSVSASRGLVMGCAVVVVAGVIAGLRTGKNVGGIVGLGVIVLIAVAVLSRFQVLQEGRSAFEERWTGDSEPGGSGGKVLASRFGQNFATAFGWVNRVPLFGLGVGLSSNLAAERKNFEAPVEGEWERVIYEIGPITGFLYLAFRTVLSLKLVASGFRSLRSDNSMCILLGAACFFDMLNNNLRQVTTYGYTCVCCGLCLAAFKAFSADSAPTDTAQLSGILEPVALERPRMRGRGPLAVGDSARQP